MGFKKLGSKKNSRIICFLFLFICVLVLLSCKSNSRKKELKSIFDLNNENYTIGVGTGSYSQVLAERELSKANILYYNSESLGYELVVSGKIDAFVFDREPMQKAIKAGLKGAKLLDDNLHEATKIAIGISKDPRLKNIKKETNAIIKELENSGILEDMLKRWVDEGKEEIPHIDDAKNPTSELVVGTTGIIPPFTFFKGDELCGYDIELAKRIAQKLNAKLIFKVYDYEGIIAALTTNDIDLAIAVLNITDERKEAIDFSDELFENKITAMVKDRSHKTPALKQFLSHAKEGFNKTFIREDRYKIFISGILCTLKITILSIIFGTILGFILFLICYNTGNIVNNVVKTVFWLLRRIPLVVLLMVFYYIIFSKLSLDSEIVATIVFTIIFGALTADLLINTIKNIDIGQSEAAYALGFSRQKTFFKILLPQTFPIMFPTYSNTIVELVRGTAVVGYVAVQDLTKVGDIVRSRTYDAFFPLIAVAIIYVFLAEFLIFVIDRARKAKGFGKESKYLKGVKRHD